MISPLFASFGLFGLLCSSAIAGTLESVYTFDFQDGCFWEPEKQYEAGGEALCPGIDGYDIHFGEFDLRQRTDFGPIDERWEFPGGFSGFNRTGSTVEWRLDDGKPFSATLRWFVQTYDDETEDLAEAQMLVVSTVADPDKPEGQRKSCIVGIVDALANPDANLIARDIADSYAREFRCGADRPKLYGATGPRTVWPNE